MKYFLVFTKYQISFIQLLKYFEIWKLLKCRNFLILVKVWQNLAKNMVKVVNIGLVYIMKNNHQCGIITLKLLQQKNIFFPDLNQNLDNIGPIFITLIL